MLLRGVADSYGTATDRMAQFVAIGAGFSLVMVGVGLVSRWLTKRGGRAMTLLGWLIVLGAAWFAGLLLGYVAVVEHIIFCVDSAGNRTDCQSSVVERGTLILLASGGWAVGVWLGLGRSRSALP